MNNDLHLYFDGLFHDEDVYVSQVEDLLGHVDLWLHKHVHDSFGYAVRRCRFITNVSGCSRNRSQVKKARDLTNDIP